MQVSINLPVPRESTAQLYFKQLINNWIDLHSITPFSNKSTSFIWPFLWKHWRGHVQTQDADVRCGGPVILESCPDRDILHVSPMSWRWFPPFSSDDLWPASLSQSVMRLAAYTGVSIPCPSAVFPIPADSIQGLRGPGHRCVPESSPSKSEFLRGLCISFAE